jgi:hypothetical protein
MLNQLVEVILSLHSIDWDVLCLGLPSFGKPGLAHHESTPIDCAITQSGEAQELLSSNSIIGPRKAATQKFERHPVLLKLQVYSMAAAGSVALAAQVFGMAGAVPPCYINPGKHEMTAADLTSVTVCC